MRRSPLAQIRASRVKAFKDGSAEPVAFFWDDPELLTDDSGDVFQIWFNDLIDDWYGISSAMIVEALLTASGRDVLVHLNSPGGMVFEGLSIHSAFKQYAGTVTMRVEGLAASAASFVMLAADEVIIEPNAMVMIHDAWDVTIGGPAEHQKALDLLHKISDNIASMYAEKSGGKAEDWRALMTAETWYTGSEALDAGLVDSVSDTVEPAEETAAAKLDWSGIFASPRPPSVRDQLPSDAPPEQRVAASLIDVNALAAAVAAKNAPPETPTPLDWSAFHASLKGVHR